MPRSLETTSSSPAASPWYGPLLRAGLVDELSLLIHPIVVGAGERLFETDSGAIPLILAESTTFSTGVIHLRYTKP